MRTYAAANGYDIGSAGAGRGTDYPVTNVSWYQVAKWCNARSEQEGLTPVYTVNSSPYRSGDSALICRVADRYGDDPSDSGNGIGFRVARSSVP